MQDKHNNAVDGFWIAVDWGTSSLRCWAMQGSQIKQFAESCDGMSQLRCDQFEPAMLSLIEQWLPAGVTTPVLACGMVGAKQGWIEAPYRQTPCEPGLSIELIQAPVNDPRLSLRIVPGISQKTPADVMRGEETLIAGLLADDADYSGIVCLPGTHCKWVDVDKGQVKRFNTVITGELFHLLSTQSVLRFNTVVNPDERSQDLFDTVFVAAINEHAKAPESLTTSLFSIRANGLLKDTMNHESRARLSGLLIAADVFSMQHYWQGKPCVLVAKPMLSHLYRLAMTNLSESPDTQISVRAMEDLTLKGLSRLAQHVGII